MGCDDEARNVAPRGATAFWAYVGTVAVAGLGLVGGSVLRLSAGDLTALGGAFAVVALLLFFGELRPLMTAGAPDANGITTSTAFVFALLIHWGLGVALLLQTIATIIADATRQKAPWRSAFNVGQYAISYGGAAAVLLVFGRGASPTHPLPVSGGDLPVIALAAITYFVLNDGLVSGALSLRAHTSFRAEFFDEFGYQVASTGALLGLAPIVVVVMERGPALVPLLVLPLSAVYATAAMSLERERQALHDALTGLPNRKLLIERAREAIENAGVTRSRVALFLLDLDRFKEVNDTLGHQVGDALLALVARRLSGSVRPNDTVARLGGDEFAVLLPDLDDDQQALDVADRIRASLTEPFHHDTMSFEIGASIGVGLFPEQAADFETLLQRADVAMYVAKERGTGIEVYRPDVDRHSALRLGLTAELRTALNEGQLEMHYQPKADLRTGEVVGAEALLRWHHPTRGLVPPDEFLPLAEQTGLMRHLTAYVLEAVCTQLSTWWAQGLRLQVAVNVSARDLYDREFAARVRDHLAAYGLPPHAVLIEVTESVLMTDATRAATTLLSLSRMGVGVSLDDFGTGYSSLVHLKRLPVTEVKIDRSFVTRMDVDDDDAAIVRSIIDLAGALGLQVVAEGVETQDAWDRLAAYGCDAAQGWHLAKAMPAADLEAWLRGLSHDRGITAPEPRRALA